MVLPLLDSTALQESDWRPDPVLQARGARHFQASLILALVMASADRVGLVEHLVGVLVRVQSKMRLGQQLTAHPSSTSLPRLAG